MTRTANDRALALQAQILALADADPRTTRQLAADTGLSQSLLFAWRNRNPKKGTSIRSACALLSALGYTLTITKCPE